MEPTKESEVDFPGEVPEQEGRATDENAPGPSGNVVEEADSPN